MTELALAAGLTAKTNQLCIGLEDGVADLYDLVTPTTAELLRWWFLADYCATRPFNFHPGQRQAILNTVVAHEVLGEHGAPDLVSLYRAVAPDALLEGKRLAEVSQAKHGHPKYCLKMATGTGKTWVMQALMIWSLLNKTAAQAEGIDDPRFTRHFLIVAPGLIVYERLLDALLGKMRDGGRDFMTSDVARYAELFIPEGQRELVFGFVRGNVCEKHEIGTKATGNGLIAIANWHALAEGEEETEPEVDAPGALADVLPLTPGKSAGNALETLDRRYARGGILDYLVGLPALMVFNDEAHHIHEVKKEGEASEVEWQKSLTRIAEKKGRAFVQVDFSATPYNDVGSGKNKRKVYFPHVAVDFDLKSAIRAGLVKSLVLDRRKEIGALPLEFNAERDADGNPTLAEGQRVMLSVGGYNDWLARLTRRIGQALSQPLPKSRKIAAHHASPYMQFDTATLAGWLERYIRERLFNEHFDPLADENWRLLLLQPVVDHITEKFALALVESEERAWQGETEVRSRRLSETAKLTMRESSSLPVVKCIYERLPFPTRNGGLERAFIEWVQADAGILAFCKISETRHDFARLRYVKEDGLPAFYSPDFLVRTDASVYLVETKAQQQTAHPNVQRKLKAAAAWCERINGLAAEYRDGREWRYALVGETMFRDWRAKGGRLADMLEFARVRPLADVLAQQSLL